METQSTLKKKKEQAKNQRTKKKTNKKKQHPVKWKDSATCKCIFDRQNTLNFYRSAGTAMSLQSAIEYVSHRLSIVN